MRKYFQIWVKMMRINTPFGSRSKPSEEREPKRTYYLVFEGLITEPLYFEGIENYRDKIGIKKDVILKQILRGYGEDGISNPACLIPLFEKSVNDPPLANKLMDILIENKLVPCSISKNDLQKLLQGLIENNPEIEIENVVKFLLKINVSCNVENIKDHLEKQNFIFEKNHDKICIIVDRDKGSFTEKQYEDVLNQCSEKGYDFYVTNPCFEFWLCLHFEEASKFDCEEEYKKILENGKVSISATYIATKLREIKPESYSSKNKTIKFEQYADGIDRAIKTIEETQRYSSNINELKHTVGSNLGNLIKEIKN